jgi:ribosomal protein S18 acetylase RimI-like enzyme
VLKEFRSKGIGKELMGFMEDFYRYNARHLFLCVSSFNKPAQVFYEHLGYHLIGELKDYLIEGESEFLMHKRLI